MCRRIALPSYEELLLLPTAEKPLFQDSFDFPFGGVVNDIGRWFEKIWSVFIGFFVWG